MSVNPLQATTLAADTNQAATPAADIPVNHYGRFADIYDVFGSEEFCLSMTTHLMEAVDRYHIEDGVQVVDLACGTGVITVELARYGFKVTGVDQSEHMLRHARQRAERAGQDIDFLQMDMREFEIDEPVSWIICTHDSLDHLFDLGDLHRAFGQVAAALVEGGYFMFDMNCWGGIRHLNAKTVFVETDDRSGAYHLTAEAQTLRTTIVGFVRRPEDGLYERFAEELMQRCYTDEEITRALESQGFTVKERISVQYLKGETFKQLWICRMPGGEAPPPDEE